MSAFRIVFLGHSGFLVETERCILIFDFYRDRQNAAAPFLSGDKPVYVFVSHVHEDHFNPVIYDWADRVSGYFVHRDCAPVQGISTVHLMEPGDTCREGDLTVQMFGSTDAGGSFLVHQGGRTIFHAGDLNWWHWAGESDAENEEARRAYFHEVNALHGMAVDVAFFPVDARQAVAREWGVMEFLSHVAVKGVLIPMHAFGIRWCPSYAFRWRWGNVPLWIPDKEGEELLQ